jgi:hypothetical protein
MNGPGEYNVGELVISCENDYFLSLISAAVTPVVMISACAVLIMGIASKHAGLSDRVRTLASEYRATPEE